MIKAGKILLLTILLLVLSKASIQAKTSFPLLTMTTPKSLPCTSLQSFLITQNVNCVDKKLTQIESVIKASVIEGTEKEPILFSHTIESAYYVEPIAEIIATEIPTPTISTTPIPLDPATTTPQQIPMDMVPANSPNLDSNLIFDLINSHRSTIGKSPFVKDDALCSLAQTRSLELYGELFGGAGYLHSGLYNRNLPYWITENAKWGSNEAGTVQWWLNSPIHRSAIDGDHVYSCGACNGSQCSQLFTSFTPKSGVVTPIN